MSDNSLATMYGPTLPAGGFVPVFNDVLDNWSKLGGTDAEFALVTQIWRYWWTPDRLPFPSVATLAQRCGKSVRMVQIILGRLVAKGLLTIKRRFGQHGQESNAYDLRPLLAKVTDLMAGATRFTPSAQAVAPHPVQDIAAEVDPGEADKPEADLSIRQAPTEVVTESTSANEAISELPPAEAMPPNAATRAEREVIRRYIQDFASEFRDKAALPVSVARAVRLWQESGQALDRFIAAMYAAREVTKRHTNTIRAEGPGGKRPLMAYWFACLADRLSRAAV